MAGAHEIDRTAAGMGEMLQELGIKVANAWVSRHHEEEQARAAAGAGGPRADLKHIGLHAADFANDKAASAYGRLGRQNTALACRATAVPRDSEGLASERVPN